MKAQIVYSVFVQLWLREDRKRNGERASNGGWWVFETIADSAGRV